MPRADFFERFGIFAIRGFLDEEACRAVVAELADAGRAPAEVYQDDYARRVDERARRTLRVSAPSGVVCGLKARLSEQRAALEAKFHTALGECEEPEFLVYGVGDFFRAHRDASARGRIHEHLKRHRVSVVLFLNGQADQDTSGTFRGGSLVFYGLIKDTRAAQVGFPLVAEPGLLVAFPSDLLHEVTPVSYGERYTVVSWFGERPEEEGVRA